MKKTACYVRVSTVGQNESGQRAEIQRWLEGHSVENVEWYVDKRSGDTLKRPAFDRLQADIFAGEIEAVVVYKIDRLSRSLRDGINVLTDWIEAGLRVVSVSQQIDFNGSQGKLIAALLLGLAEMEQQTRRERQAAGIAVAKREGKYKGRVKGSTTASPAKALKLREKGLSLSEIAASLGISRRTAIRYLKTDAKGGK